ncbi:unnamed protein product [Blepharisma stoltei]|uniref:Uncharacterized protein n=1 Tax=Blepharisma stoltei TaxID=1481888 RepID=A0AAU9JT06_9CILI|nr:unnamed protein product [Blepharisma stoltei]
MKPIIILLLSLVLLSAANEEAKGRQTRELGGYGHGSSNCGKSYDDCDDYSPCKPSIPIQPTNTSINTTGPANCSCSCNCSCWTCNCSCSCIVIPPPQNTTQPNVTNCTCPPKPSCSSPCESDDYYECGHGNHWIEGGIDANRKLRDELINDVI